MTKAEILNVLKSTGEDKLFRRSVNWEKAFKLYKDANPSSHKNMNCGTCFRDILTWLQS